MNLNSQNILSNTKKIETDNIDSKEDIITPKASKKNEQKQSIFSKLFKKNILRLAMKKSMTIDFFIAIFYSYREK